MGFRFQFLGNEERSQVEFFAASGWRLFLQARMSPGMLDHRRWILRLLRSRRRCCEKESVS